MSDAERFRPRYHFTPQQNWMNDPNGLVYAEGIYHLYYQHNPYGTGWGHMSWGHATSEDLVRWTYQPVAMWEQPDAGYTLFSGSAVVDHANTSGFGMGGVAPMVAVYSADHRAQDPQVQDIHVAYSLDRGQTFAEYLRNPVLAVDARKFGDPKVFWHEATERWIMVSIRGLGQGHAVLYGSPNLRQWTQLSDFRAPNVAPGVWECPDLFPLAVDSNPEDVRWVFKVNYVAFGGGPASTCYFLGDFDGVTFTQSSIVGRSLTSDDGAIYAEVTFNDVPDGRRIQMGWLREQPEAERPWTGAQAVPRVLSLRRGRAGVELCQKVVGALASLRGTRYTVRDQELYAPLVLDGVDVSGGALEVLVVLDLRGATEGSIRMRLGSGQDVRVAISRVTGELYVTVGDGDRVATKVALDERPVSLRVFFDQEIVEAFFDDTAAVTTLLPYGATYQALSVEGGDVPPHLVRADVWELADTSCQEG